LSFVALLIDVLGPVVAIVAVGALAGPRLRLGNASLSRVAYWVLGPAFVFDLFVTTDLVGPTVIRLAVAGLAGMAAAVAGAVLLGRATGISGRPLSAAVMTAAYGNVGNAGLAISAFALGQQALAAAGVLMLTINITGVTLGVGLASASDEGLLPTLGRALFSPMPLAGAVAFVINVIDIEIPLVVGRSTGLLAQAMIPLMLFTLGLQLAATGRPQWRPAIGVATVAKLVLAPLGAAAAAGAVGLSGDDLAVVVLQSAMPPAVFCVLVGLEYDLEPAQVTDTVVMTTLASLVTLPVVLALVA